MEPLTHRLSEHASRVPCTKTFQPKYRALNRAWLVATPEIQLADSPIIPQEFGNKVKQWDRTTDWSTGGLYTQEELLSLSHYLEFNRVRSELT